MLTPLSPVSFLPWIPKVHSLGSPVIPLTTDLGLFCCPLSLSVPLETGVSQALAQTFYFPISHALPEYVCFVINLCHWLWNEISIPVVAPELCSCIFSFPLDSSNYLFCGLLTLDFSHQHLHKRRSSLSSSSSPNLSPLCVLHRGKCHHQSSSHTVRYSWSVFVFLLPTHSSPPNINKHYLFYLKVRYP